LWPYFICEKAPAEAIKYRSTQSVLQMGHTVIGTLSLDHLRVLVSIVDKGSFSAAGRQLGRAQSAISQSIAVLEETQGVVLFDRKGYRPVLTAAGQVLVEHARFVLATANRFEAVAASHRSGLEPELALAIDPLVPTAPLIESLRHLHTTYPDLPVHFSTEGMGGSIRRLRERSAVLGICVLLPSIPDELTAYPLLKIRLRAVVSPNHTLAKLGRPIRQVDLEQQVQLVLTDPTRPSTENYGLLSTRLWRFVDLSRRMDFLIAGFGWCRMPEHLIAGHIQSGHLIALEIEDDQTPQEDLLIHAAHRRDYVLGPAGRWLLNDLQNRTKSS
jgi:DNA-binding transcriptional LysR family regulator